MLSTSFLEPERLGLTPQERDAAIKVLGMMERAELTYVRSKWFLPFPRRGFNMSYSWRDGIVGCIGCIGGWIGRELGMKPANIAHWMQNHPSQAFRDLCYSCVSDSITVEMAAAALRNFLTLGNPLWEMIKEEFNIETEDYSPVQGHWIALDYSPVQGHWIALDDVSQVENIDGSVTISFSSLCDPLQEEVA